MTKECSPEVGKLIVKDMVSFYCTAPKKAIAT